MTDLSISVEGIGKRYRLGTRSAYPRLSEAISEIVRRPVSAYRRLRTPRDGESEFWALRDVDFRVHAGEVVGIIGRNGAGKSTLLKILSRITRPTRGRATIRGRLASLLEVGTGFHPDLTGRENVFLNGTLLGMQDREIRSRFDEIVAFAELAQFIDTPVKRYSSGMYVRLGFAVAAYLEPDVLLVDEVLAVGDARFQKRCMTAIEHAGQSGRAILFVSHNMSAVTRLCPRAILLDHGRVIADGAAADVVQHYLKAGTVGGASRVWADLEDAPGNAFVKLRSVRIVDTAGSPTGCVDIRDRFGIQMEWDVLQAGVELVPNFHCYNEEGLCLFIAADRDPAWRGRLRERGRYRSTAWVPGNLLSECTLVVTAVISTMTTGVAHLTEPEVVAVQIIEGSGGDAARVDYAGHIPGAVRPMLDWTTEHSAGSPPLAGIDNVCSAGGTEE